MNLRVQENDTVEKGHCVYMIDDQAVYVGRIKDSPMPTSEMLILLNPVDYEWLVARFEAYTIH